VATSDLILGLAIGLPIFCICVGFVATMVIVMRRQRAVNTMSYYQPPSYTQAPVATTPAPYAQTTVPSYSAATAPPAVSSSSYALPTYSSAPYGGQVQPSGDVPYAAYAGNQPQAAPASQAPPPRKPEW